MRAKGPANRQLSTKQLAGRSKRGFGGGGFPRRAPARGRALEPDRVAELVGAKAVPLKFLARMAQDVIRCKGSQQLEMAGSGLVRAADDGIDHAQLRVGADALVGQARTGVEFAARGRMFQRPRHCRAQRDDTAAAAILIFSRLPCVLTTRTSTVFFR